jgi:hypothetical protein
MTSATAGVPSSIDGVTPQWLTAALDGATVTDVHAEQIALDGGFSSRLYRAHLSGDGVPKSVIVKLPAESEAGDAMKMLGGYASRVLPIRRRERRSAPRMSTRMARAPTSFWCWGLAGLGQRRSPRGLSLDRARCCIAQLAGSTPGRRASGPMP